MRNLQLIKKKDREEIKLDTNNNQVNLLQLRLLKIKQE